MQMGEIDSNKMDRELIRELPRLENWLPVRISAMHLCTDNPVVSLLWRTAIMGTSREARVRHRVHFGSFTEIMYSLLGFGIPVDVFPVNESGGIKKTNWNRWISKYKAKEKELTLIGTGIFRGIDLPRGQDVLTGRGKPMRQHPGNVHLRNLVEQYMDESSDGMTEAVENVFVMIKAKQGRFLYQCEAGWWWDISDVEAE